MLTIETKKLEISEKLLIIMFLCKYELKEIDGKKYIFVEWKSGDYIFGKIVSGYYVLEKIN